MTNGIFDNIGDALERADAQDEALEAGADRVTARFEAEEKLAEEKRERAARIRRQEMLLVERLVDEWPETKAFLAARLDEARETVGLVLEREQRKLSNRWIDMVARVAQRVYERELDREEAMARLGNNPEGGDPKARAVERVFGRVLQSLEKVGLIRDTPVSNGGDVRVGRASSDRDLSRGIDAVVKQLEDAGGHRAVRWLTDELLR